MRTFRADIVIATLALLISAGATISSLYQTKVIANQLSSSVWPYLSIESDLSPNEYTLAVVNDGLGPALIRSASIAVDGKRVAKYRDGLRAFAVRAHLKRGTVLQSSFSTLGATSVIRPADRHQLIDIKGAPVATLGNLTERVSLKMCYCSILDQCWTVEEAVDKPRVQVDSCPDHDELAY